MSITSSPLRYLVGKSSLFNMIDYLLNNHLIGIKYAEPYAGCAGLALKLLIKGYVNKIYINDLDAGIYAFWYSILNNTDAFIKLINDTPITREERYKRQAVLVNPKDNNILQLGFIHSLK